MYRRGLRRAGHGVCVLGLCAAFSNCGTTPSTLPDDSGNPDSPPINRPTDPLNTPGHTAYLGACCFGAACAADESDFCEDLSVDRCVAEGGTPLGTGTGCGRG